MIFRPARLRDVWLVEVEPHRDERGFFARTWCRDEFEAHGLDPGLAQASLSYNRRAGTVRGLHFQRPPHEEVKLVRCTRGAIFDVVVDLRSGSPTEGHWQGFELSARNGLSLYVPKGFAHGFQTLVPETDVLYLISTPQAPEAAAGVRFDDPAIGVEWPMPIAVISDRDRAWPDYRAVSLTGMR